VEEPAQEAAVKAWTCSMHPQIQLPEPGKCPICFMDLIPVTEESQDEEPRQLVMSEAAKQLAEVQTAAVERRTVSKPVRMVGKVDYDETRLATIAAWVNGRIERLYVDFTGISVRKGDHMMRLYSPELRATQAELVSAARSAARFGAGDKSPGARNARALLRAAGERLRLWGLTQGQIARLRSTGKVSDYVTIYAPLAGVVIHKQGMEGMYVKPGTRIYTIADLSVVWVHLEAYESDLPWLRYGQQVEVVVEKLGKKINGTISFIDPFLHEKKRTARVRVVVDNPDGSLRPGMYVNGIVQAQLLGAGTVAAPDLTGKWVCPMHPEVIRDRPGRCNVCGMPLEKAEKLGLTGPSDESLKLPLVIPATAPLITGKRAVVYVQVPRAERPTYAGREVELGPRAGDDYVVLSGLSEGEQVVVEGNFKIDSAMQILAKPSMMNPTGGGPPPGHAHHAHGDTAPAAEKPKPQKTYDAPAAFIEGLMAFTDGYLVVQEALAADDFDAAKKGARGLPDLLKKIDMKVLGHEAHTRWMKHLGALNEQAEALKNGGDIAAIRSALSPLSNTLIAVLSEFGAPAEHKLHRVHCPMAFDNRGAWWIQKGGQVANPYFGESMLRCADINEPMSAGKK
jgi:Cu(I)/Ag(I) efflux system membrane fusion protein